MRRRFESRRTHARGLKTPFYTTPLLELQALRSNRRRLQAAARARGCFVSPAATLNSAAVDQTAAAISTARRDLPLLAQKHRGVSHTVLRSRKHFENRLYRRQLKLRLPCSRVSRKNLRHGGHVLFARNTLKFPTTLPGARRLLLAPKVSWVLSGNAPRGHTATLPAQLRRLEKRDDFLPRA